MKSELGLKLTRVQVLWIILADFFLIHSDRNTVENVSGRMTDFLTELSHIHSTHHSLPSIKKEKNKQKGSLKKKSQAVFGFLVFFFRIVRRNYIYELTAKFRWIRNLGPGLLILYDRNFKKRNFTCMFSFICHHHVLNFILSVFQA